MLYTKSAFRHWWGANRLVMTNAFSLSGAMIANSGLGMLFWWIAARYFAPEAVGLSSAVLSAMTLLATFANLGMGTLLISELPKRKGTQASLILAAVIAPFIVGVVVAIGAALLFFGPANSDLAMLGKNFNALCLFAMGVGLTAASMVLDQALLALLKGMLQFYRNLIFASAKLALLAILGLVGGSGSPLSIYVVWVVGMIVSLVVLGVCFYRSLPEFHAPDFRALGNLRQTVLFHHWLNLVQIVPGLLLPILVATFVSTTANASFYTAWMIVSIVFIAPSSLAMALYAVGAGNAERLRHKFRHSLSMSYLIGGVGALAIWIGSPFILRIFGKGYAEQAEWCLRILVLGVFPLIIKWHYVAINRIEGKLEQIALQNTFMGLAEIIGATVGAITGGLTGLSIGWVLALGLNLAVMLRRVVQIAHVVQQPEGD